MTVRSLTMVLTGKRQAKGKLLISPDGIFMPSFHLLIINLGTLGAIVSAIKL